MPDALLSWLILAILFLCIVLIVVLWAYTRNIKAKLLQSIGLIDELHKLSQANNQTIEALKVEFKSDLAKSSKQATELQLQCNKFTESVAQRMNKVEDTVECIAEQDPALKMYRQASKLVAQGMPIEDIMEASGLPRAELEVLIALSANK